FSSEGRPWRSSATARTSVSKRQAPGTLHANFCPHLRGPLMLSTGEIIDGKYRIVRLLGEGGMGAVYEGDNTRIHRRVAIKILHSNVAEQQEAVQRFER